MAIAFRMSTESVARELAPAGCEVAPPCARRPKLKLSMKRPRLTAVTALSNNRLALDFVDGRKLMFDLSRDIQTYPQLQPLLDPQVFATAILGDNGWTVEWPVPDIQIGADTLYLDAFSDTTPNPHQASAAHSGH
ncbi:hypothetical protein EMIT0347P_40631 [Pseudomonas sp. IT-347P]